MQLIDVFQEQKASIVCYSSSKELSFYQFLFYFLFSEQRLSSHAIHPTCFKTSMIGTQMPSGTQTNSSLELVWQEIWQTAEKLMRKMAKWEKTVLDIAILVKKDQLKYQKEAQIRLMFQWNVPWYISYKLRCSIDHDTEI